MNNTKISVSRTFGTHPNIRIDIEDLTSGVTMMVATMDFESFAKCITGNGSMPIHITHWMPLPEGPKQ